MWINDIETAVFSRIKARGSPLKKYFPKIFFTTENETAETVAVFPTVYLEKLPGIERNKDLETNRVNTFTFDFQIHVIHNGKKQEVIKIMDNCMETMRKHLKFDVRVGTECFKEKGVWKCRATFRRTIDWNDIL